MRRWRAALPQRRPVFLGCEGESEFGYGALVRRLLEEHRRDLHLDVTLLRPGGGDPLALVELACEKIRDTERKRDIRYSFRAVLLDKDKLGNDRQRHERMLRLARIQRLLLIWQEPSHEGFLLRHLDGCQTLRPQTSADALAELLRHWPNYRKGTSAAQLLTHIRAEQIKAAAAVEPSLSEFLHNIGFL